MKKKYFLIGILILLGTNLSFAQEETMFILRNGEEVFSVPVAEIGAISFQRELGIEHTGTLYFESASTSNAEIPESDEPRIKINESITYAEENKTDD